MMRITKADRRRMQKALVRVRASQRVKDEAKLEKVIEAYAAQFKSRNEGIKNGILRAAERMQQAAAEAFRQRKDEVALDRRRSGEDLQRYAEQTYVSGEAALREAIKVMRKGKP